MSEYQIVTLNEPEMAKLRAIHAAAEALNDALRAWCEDYTPEALVIELRPSSYAVGAPMPGSAYPTLSTATEVVVSYRTPVWPLRDLASLRGTMPQESR